MKNGVFIEAYIAMITLEGGYSNHAADRGGETYRGISRKFWPQWEGWARIDQLKEPGDSIADINESCENDGKLAIMVQSFYRTNFWEPLNCDKLPHDVAHELFDTAVNQGVSTAGRYFQESVNFLNRGGSIFKNIKVDGKIGPVTLAAFDAVRIFHSRYRAQRFVRAFIKCLDGFQFMRYHDITKNDESQEVFFFGWIDKRIGNVG